MKVTDSDVCEIKGVCVVVNNLGLKDDEMQPQSESTPNPQNLSLVSKS